MHESHIQYSGHNNPSILQGDLDMTQGQEKKTVEQYLFWNI